MNQYSVLYWIHILMCFPNESKTIYLVYNYLKKTMLYFNIETVICFDDGIYSYGVNCLFINFTCYEH